ncbi:hypothetical protein GCM10011494_33040 [Novosphingobium endophyticum]|uniref:SnoaL-like domain-containing protein n=1 Tax=Novosphingobium endophyticum TaxID=1955250 RepID=A0A916TVE9_9SPHN|nr:nuclear transport factor 2 family protein [Novosphingobium endophyticum]GGC11642.1 hypothetical protein GCM10011494_33040 [Novosphingobium endophyticum]
MTDEKLTRDNDTRTAVIAYISTLNAGDADAIASRVAPDFVNEHIAEDGLSLAGRNAYRQRLQGFLAEFSELHYEIVDMIVEGDQAAVAYRMRYNWKGKQPFRRIETRGMFHFKVQDGLIARRTDYRDSAVSRRQMEG